MSRMTPLIFSIVGAGALGVVAYRKYLAACERLAQAEKEASSTFTKVSSEIVPPATRTEWEGSTLSGPEVMLSNTEGKLAVLLDAPVEWEVLKRAIALMQDSLPMFASRIEACKDRLSTRLPGCLLIRAEVDLGGKFGSLSEALKDPNWLVALSITSQSFLGSRIMFGGELSTRPLAGVQVSTHAPSGQTLVVFMSNHCLTDIAVGAKFFEAIDHYCRTPEVPLKFTPSRRFVYEKMTPEKRALLPTPSLWTRFLTNLPYVRQRLVFFRIRLPLLTKHYVRVRVNLPALREYNTAHIQPFMPPGEYVSSTSLVICMVFRFVPPKREVSQWVGARGGRFVPDASFIGGNVGNCVFPASFDYCQRPLWEVAREYHATLRRFQKEDLSSVQLDAKHETYLNGETLPSAGIMAAGIQIKVNSWTAVAKELFAVQLSSKGKVIQVPYIAPFHPYCNVLPEFGPEQWTVSMMMSSEEKRAFEAGMEKMGWGDIFQLF